MVNPVYSSPDVAKIRSRYRARDTVYFDPCEVVFQAKVASVPDAAEGTYLEIEYDTVSIGDETDIREGQMLIISETSDHMIPVQGYRDMRVSKTPTSSILYINESALTLDTDYYITVVNTYRRLQKVRKGALVDGHLPYEGLAPTIKGLKSCQFVESTTTGQFSFPDVVGVSLTGGTITYEWEMPGVVYNTGSSTSQNPVVTALHGHTWGRLKIIDSNGPTQWMAFQLIVQDPSNPTLAAMNIDNLSLNRVWQGHHATCRAYAGVSITSIMNGTRAVIVSRRTYAGGVLDGEMDNVSFVGYLSKEANSTQSISDKSVSFDLVSIWEGAGQLPFNPIAVRDVASPDSWDEMDLPTTQRVVAHVLARYSTILNLCALDLDVIDDTWYGGDMDVNATSLGDAISQVLSEINAEIIQNPSGELFLRRDLRYEGDTNRDAADVIWTLTSADLRSLDMQMRHDEQTGRIIIGFRGYQTTRVPSKGGKAVAPAVVLGTSPETKTRNNQLMPANLTAAQLITEAELRSGDVLAAENPPFQLTGAVYGRLSWLNPSCSQWVAVDVSSSLNTRGQNISVRSLLVSLEIRYDTAASSHDVTLELLPETRGGAAMIVAALTPNVSGLSMYILPPMPAYSGSYGGPSTLNSVDGEGPAFGGHNTGGGNPVPGDQAWEDAEYAPEVGKTKFAISFANESNVAAGFTSVLDAPYTITAVGSACITTGLTVCTNLKATQGPYVGAPDSGYGQHFAGQGLGGVDIGGGDAAFSWFHPTYTLDSRPIKRIDFFFNQPQADMRIYNYNDTMTFPASLSSISITDVTFPTFFPFNLQIGGFGFTTDDNIVPTGFRVTRICIYPTDDPEYADAFYTFKLDEEGNETNIALLGALAGLFIDNSTAASPPPYSADHKYEFDWTGTGSPPLFRFEDPDSNWDDNENKPLHITVEGEGVDS